LNGDPGGRIDAIIYPLPSGGPGPSAYRDIRSYVEQQPLWLPAQKRGVRRLTSAYSSYVDRGGDNLVMEYVREWGFQLEELGISMHLLGGGGLEFLTAGR
jgi:hypothetical protein